MKKKEVRIKKQKNAEIRVRPRSGRDLVFLRIFSIGLLVGLAAVAGFVTWLLVFRNDGSSGGIEFSEQTPQESETAAEEELIHDGTVAGVVSAVQGVRDALNERQKEVVLSASEAADFARIGGVRITDGGKVSISCESPGLLASDDKNYYLFENAVYENGLSEGQEPIATTSKDAEFDFSVDLKRGSAGSRLFSKFFVAVKMNGSYVPISHARYVENPGAVASYNYSGRSHSSKKGLLIDPSKSTSGEWDDLGVQYATYNFPLSHILGATSNGAYPTISYDYHGKTWHFNGAHIHEYDFIFSTLTAKGIDITAIILNNASTSAYPELTHPAARSGSTAPYNMFNGETADGVEACGAVASFLAGRYSGGQYGKVQNWIIGNEVNARQEWNYMPASTDLGTYAAAYARAFRVFYNAIKSVNSGAGVYICLDQQWDRNRKGNPDYDARDLLDTFAADIKAYGDIDWGLAYHAYTVPLYKAQFWEPTNLVTNSADTSFITMKNIRVLTDYMHRESLLTSDGQVRSVILSEQGYTSTAGEAVQAAAFAYAYKIAAANPDIDIFIYSRETDHASEVAQNLALGLNNTGGGHKQIYNVYKHIDKADSSSVIDFALGIIGISSWP